MLPRSITVQKKVLSFSNKVIGGWPFPSHKYFLLNKPDTKPESISITITGAAPPEVNLSQIDIPPKLSFSISPERVKKIFSQILTITCDPFAVAEYLKPLDAELAALMQARGLVIDENILPDYLLTGCGFFIPGPPKIPPYHKGRLLDELLLSKEQPEGININGAPIFFAVLSREEVEEIVSNGEIFGEEEQISNVNFHGTYTHRLMIQALWIAAQKGELDLTIDEKTKQKLSLRQFLELLIMVKYDNESLWLQSFDNFIDSISSHDLLKKLSEGISSADISKLNPGGYSYSDRSPFVFHMLLVCFGKELGLPTIQRFLLDHSYKDAYKMLHKAEQHIESSRESLAGTNKTDMYIRLMNILATMAHNFGGVPYKSFFTIDPASYVPPEEKYAVSSPGIARPKSGAKKPIGRYGSWDEYIKASSLSGSFFKNTTTNIENKNEPTTLEKGVNRR
ncbi:MAG: hypothetical protein A3F12_06345 [Gammaproteobacteria bacterium RIFCSPHIGHO2_12_FULL_38_14]|nr:MAG: hypothetical protein A3F12_06345 [Gammaproteobacteria bacterium RIFCSPHIGHO2_12_FULL_38_14]